ncbi:hypothetical protein SAMN02910447_00582 [Ruminococcus sp. YE71]|uniref:hypothetical protein n=1 Tax=unclassified Ruminococcus TaxID=2608920 RepID=UPI0008806B8E|nr:MULTISPECIES: hypothetical protein [unclassified Ruminococcus]SDA12362.1 hypothetical protein SAMN02910446_00581 [Ruminococcus sp. YE78]SFW16810.1 hypothetical protein SAMN02910447_00582 [Ruminococcus sp. YE71]
MDNEVVKLLVRVMLTSMGLMAVIMVCCVVTPRLAKFIDSHRKTPPADSTPDGTPEVRGAFDAQSDPEYDLNYKIYNKDIYGVDFRHGKEKQNGRSDNLDG